MHIHIENINVYINGDDVKELIEGPVTFDIETTDFPEEAAAAEEVLYEAQDEEVTPAEDYWEETVDAAVKQPTFAPKSLVKVSDSTYPPYLQGKVGRVCLTDEGGAILVEFEGLTLGHDGDLGDGAINRRWFFDEAQLSPYTLKVGDKVVHKGDGTGEPANDEEFKYCGCTDESLVGKVGTVVADVNQDYNGEILIEWDNWNDGHDMRAHHALDLKQNRWWSFSDNLNKVEQWNS